MLRIHGLASLALSVCFVCPAVAIDIFVAPGESIQEAIDLAVDGDRVLVEPGTYLETLDFLGKAIDVESTAGRDVTFLDGQSLDSVVRFVSGEGPDSVLRGFTLIQSGAGSPVVGGGVFCSDSSPIIETCRFEGIASPTGSGIYAIGAASNLTVTSCEFIDNTSGGGGGGIYVTDCESVTVTGCLFSGNDSVATGGGLVVCSVGEPTEAVVDGCEFLGCSSLVGGGFLYSTPGGTLQLSASNFEGNDAAFGGALTTSSMAFVDGCRIVNNTAGSGGGIMFTEFLDLRSTLIAGNEADLGSAIRSSNGTNTLQCTNCTLADNVFLGDPAISLNNNPTTTLTLTSCILWGNAIPNFASPTATITYTDVEGGFPGIGNIDSDPLFTDPLSSDYRLTTGSPCIDAGDPMGPPDPNGTPPDMGAFPYNASALSFLRGDANGDASFNGLVDGLFLLNFGFTPGSPEPPCDDAADGDDDGTVNPLVDGVFLLTFQFIPGSNAPPPPGPSMCGIDPTVDFLVCIAGGACP